MRVDALEQLLAFGADPHLPNAAGDSAESIISAMPISPERNRMLRLIRGVALCALLCVVGVYVVCCAEYADKEAILPSVVLDKRRQRTYACFKHIRSSSCV